MSAVTTRAAPAPRPAVATDHVDVGAALLVALATTVLVAAALTLNLLPRAYEVREGDVAPYSVRAPRRASYVSQIRTREAREQAAAQIAPIIEMDYARVAEQRRGLSDLLQAVQQTRTAAANRTPDQRREAIRQLTRPPLSDATARRLAELDEPGWGALSAEADRLLWDVLKERIPEEGLETARASLPLRVQPSLAAASRDAAVELASRFLVANLVANDAATARARRDAQDAVAPVVQIYERNQTIVRDGQVIGPFELEALESLGLRNPEVDWRSVGGSVLLAGAVVGTLSAYVWQFHRRMLLRRRRVIILLASLLVIATLAAKMVIPGRPLWVYVFPLPAVSMLLASLLEARLAALVGALLAVVVSWIAGGSLEIAALMLVGSTVGALAVWRKDRFLSYFVAGLYVALAQIGVYLAFQLGTRADDWQLTSIVAFELLFNGLLSAALTVGTVVAVGRLFGILTSMHLLELASPTQPLLRRLLMEAPGTYHHSIMVGNLAERAAEVIGADSLLVRVAAYYHDIGKLERPWAFIENQADSGENIHESLEPADSAQLIAAHVLDGVSLAEKHGLPPRIRDMIPQHHGTRRISFFYQQAATAAGGSGGSVDPDLFTYPGPRPQSREAAILMLSDSVEAAARAARDHSKEAIERLVEGIVRERLEEGQFDDSNLTLRDLTEIKRSFVTLLSGIYHPRIPYPPGGSATGERRTAEASRPPEPGRSPEPIPLRARDARA